MSDSTSVGEMYNPPHPGECMRESVQASGLTVGETAAKLGVNRATLSRVLNGHAGISPNMAIALERIGWGEAELWVGMQGSYDLAQARAKAA